MIVFCEGEASEPDYINGLKRLPHIRDSTSVRIEVDPCRGVPFTLVTAAINRKATDGEEIDEVWCVFDVESPKMHPNLLHAVALAKKHGIKLAISNPCFELWLILHFEDQTAYLTTSQAESKSRKFDGRDGKRINPDLYLEKRQIAAERAAYLTKRHEGNSTLFPQDNPSSSMVDLLLSVDSEVVV